MSCLLLQRGRLWVAEVGSCTVLGLLQESAESTEMQIAAPLNSTMRAQEPVLACPPCLQPKMVAGALTRANTPSGTACLASTPAAGPAHRCAPAIDAARQCMDMGLIRCCPFAYGTSKSRSARAFVPAMLLPPLHPQFLRVVSHQTAGRPSVNITRVGSSDTAAAP